MQTEATTCGDCAEARRRVREAMGAFEMECVCGRVHRAKVQRVYRADPDAPTPERGALERAGHAALTTDSPELVRVRRVLADLRPDCPDPMQPPQSDEGRDEEVTVRVKMTRAFWDVDIPHGLASGVHALNLAWAFRVGATTADVLREVDALPADAATVLRWMRAHATLAEGLRGLHFDAGMRFAGAEQREAWRDLTARRVGAVRHGERLVTRACEAWEQRGRT